MKQARENSCRNFVEGNEVQIVKIPIIKTRQLQHEDNDRDTSCLNLKMEIRKTIDNREEMGSNIQEDSTREKRIGGGSKEASKSYKLFKMKVDQVERKM